MAEPALSTVDDADDRVAIVDAMAALTIKNTACFEGSILSISLTAKSEVNTLVAPIAMIAAFLPLNVLATVVAVFVPDRCAR